MEQTWLNRAALYEIMAPTFLLTKEELVRALVSGEYQEAFDEIAAANGLDDIFVRAALGTLQIYQSRNSDEVLHELRQEYTRLYVGSPKAAVSPFAGAWSVEETETEPLLFVNKEAMAVERFMRSCGVGQPKGANEPLDHISAELEFLQFLCLLRSGSVVQPEGSNLSKNAYEDFYREHFIDFAHKVAAATVDLSRVPFFCTTAEVLSALPAEP